MGIELRFSPTAICVPKDGAISIRPPFHHEPFKISLSEEPTFIN